MNHYTIDELRELGCPNGLLIQYISCTKEEITNLLLWHLINNMDGK